MVIDCSIRFSLLSPFVGSAAGLVVRSLVMYDPSTYFRPAVLLHLQSLMPQLEILLLYSRFAIPKLFVEREQLLTPIMTYVTLPNLRVFGLLPSC